MKTICIANGEIQASEISLGCMRLPGLSGKEAEVFVQTALDEGINFRIASLRNHRERVSHCIIKNHSEIVECVTAPREMSWLVFPRSRASRM